jgi:hypothetical protein
LHCSKNDCLIQKSGNNITDPKAENECKTVSFALRPSLGSILEDALQSGLHPQAEVTNVNGKRERYRPGEPEKRVRAGTTVFGGMIVLSAILAQSLMIENLP